MGKKKNPNFDAPYYCYIGDSKNNPPFPRNSQKTSAFAYLVLLIKVIIKEITTFYSLYFIIIGILESFPGITTTSWWKTILPLIIVFLLEYGVQAKGLYNAQKSNREDDKRFYKITRDHNDKELPSKNIQPGDLIEICDQATVPCDCILLHTEQSSIFINTSKIDGETDVKDRIPLKVPLSLKDNEIFKNIKAKVVATPARSGIREVSGDITFQPNQNVNFESDESSEFSSEPRSYQHELDGSIKCNFDTSSFIERGSLIETDGHHLLLALYTGKNCRSDSTLTTTTTRNTLIDNYLDKISIFIFLFQFIISAVFSVLGYLQVRKECNYYFDLKKTQSNYQPYIPSSLLHCDDIGMWMILVIFIRNFLMLSFMVPITLKILLPIFRFIYGVFFISKDLNFVDPDTGNKAFSISTNITENLGALNVIITDKTGTLTKNKLTFTSIVIGDKKYGDSRRAPTIIEDQELQKNLQSSSEEYFVLTFQALSVCHTIKVNEGSQAFHGSSQDDLSILTALQKLGWKWHENLDYRHIESPLGDFDLRILKVNTFDRKRMAMSVVVRIGDSDFCFMKGASERVIRACNEKSGDLATNYEMYQKKGLRTISVSFKKLDRFDPDLPVEELESDHTLLATLGIEDALQNDVQLTLDILSDAGLKIWVATGDAKMNTLVVSSMLHLLRQNEPIVHIDVHTLRDEARLNEGDNNNEGPVEFSKKAMLAQENGFATIVNAEDDYVLRLALQQKDFLNALYRSRCVIFYRCKPITKSDIAIALQNAGKRVLGVGDGYNDTLLLRAADVGVGIIASDGSKSFASCDFAIPAFRSLGRLILIHGHQALHRSVLVVHFSFYKAVMFAICQSVYQIWTEYSGQSLFDSFALVCFNNIWTLLPIISLLFEKDIGENFLYRLSYLYDKLRNPLTLSASNTTWFFVAVYQGCIIMLISWALTGEAFLDPNGKDYGAPYLSLILYFSMVLISSFYMLYQTNTFTYYSMVLIFGNIMLLIASSALLQSPNSALSKLFDGSWIGFYGECFNNTNTLIVILTIVLAAVSPSWLILTVWSEFRNSDSIRIIETETNAAKNDVPLFFDPPRDD